VRKILYSANKGLVEEIVFLIFHHYTHSWYIRLNTQIKHSQIKFVSMRNHVIFSVYFAFHRPTEGKSIILQNYTSFNLCFFRFKVLYFQFPLHYMQWTLSCTFHILMSFSKQTGEEISTIIICLPSFSVKEHQVELWTSYSPSILISYSMN